MASTFPNPLLREALSLQAAGKHGAAVLAFERVRKLQPTCWEAHHYAGLALLMMQRYQEATVLLQSAVQLAPGRTDSGVALGLALLALGNCVEAEATLRQLLVRNPKAADVHDSLALALRSQGRFDEAKDAHQAATRFAPKNAAYWVNQGNTLLNTKYLEEAQTAFAKACNLDPKNVQAINGRAICLFRTHRVGDALELFRKVLALNPRQPDVHSNLLMALQSMDGLTKEEVFAAHQKFGALVGNPVRSLATRRVEPEGILRVGLISEDFHAHSVCYFLKPLLRHAKDHGIEVILYHDGAVFDDVSEQLRSMASVWRRTAGQMHPLVEQLILSDAPDVMIDLAGHAGSNRLQVLARRVAPVQITYLGYPDTTGVPAMDFRFADPISDPEGIADSMTTERLVRFSTTAWCYEAPDVPLMDVSRHSGDGPVFGCFNKFAKVTDTVLREWAKLLCEVPNSKLLIKSIGIGMADTNQDVIQRMKRAGMPVDRVELLGMVPGVESHLALYGRVDVALDTFPYNGTTTTCEALWMGVPVVTLSGDRHVARVGTSLLNAVGHENWVATSWDQYRAIAKRLALSCDAADDRGERLRSAIRQSIVMNSEVQSARFWKAVRACYGSCPRR